jgi:hypothetical protein
MNELRTLGRAEPLSIPMWPTQQIGLDAARQFWDRSQAIATALVAWNSEVSSFVGQRISRDGETIGQMVQCQSWSEALDIEMQWLRNAADDYGAETSKLLELNTKLVGNMVPWFGHDEAHQSSAKPPTKASGDA